jgi:hypothetical protein
MDWDPILQLLHEQGIDVDPSEWITLDPRPGGYSPRPRYDPPPLPTQPCYYDEDDLPVFTKSQLNNCAPEVFGYERYSIVEDAEAAHPFGLNYADEVHWRRWHRPIHRYDRPYRIRRTLAFVTGYDCQAVPEDVLRQLKRYVTTADLMSWHIYDRVRALLKRWRLAPWYSSIPHIIVRLGGPRWRVSTDQFRRVSEDALTLHRRFDHFRRQERLQGNRRRFPKMQFVLLRLLDRHGVHPPYRVPWARTYIKRRQLWHLLDWMERQDLYPPTTTTTTSRWT